MAYLPVMLKVGGRKIIVVGGGPVAARRTLALLDAGAQVVVVAPQVDSRLDQTAALIHRRAYQSSDLIDAWAVVIATNNPTVNQQVAADAAAGGVLVNRADDALEGDFIVPAHRRTGPVTIAVATDGISASAARQIVQQLHNALDPDWPRILEIIAPYRAQVQQTHAQPALRQDMLRRLTDEKALAAYKTGGIDALHRHAREVIKHAP